MSFAAVGGALATAGGWAASAAPVVGLAGGLGSMFGGGGEGQPGSGGGVYLQPNDFPWMTDRLKQDYGQEPEWWKKIKPEMQAGMEQDTYETYYGTPGQRTGVMQGAVQAGAMTGIGPKATNANVSKVGSQYATARRQISDFINQQTSTIIQENNKNTIFGLPQYQTRAIPYGGYGATPGSTAGLDALTAMSMASGYGSTANPYASGSSYNSTPWNYENRNSGYGGYSSMPSGGSIADNYAGTGSKYTPTQNSTNPSVRGQVFSSEAPKVPFGSFSRSATVPKDPYSPRFGSRGGNTYPYWMAQMGGLTNDNLA
jgi:hypothetical protein